MLYLTVSEFIKTWFMLQAMTWTCEKNLCNVRSSLPHTASGKDVPGDFSSVAVAGEALSPAEEEETDGTKLDIVCVLLIPPQPADFDHGLVSSLYFRKQIMLQFVDGCR